MTQIVSREKVNWKDNIVIVANDKTEFEVSKELIVASSPNIKNLMEMNNDDHQAIPVSCANGKTIGLVLSFIGHHENNPPVRIKKPLRVALNEAVSDWDLTFVQGMMKGDDYTQLREVAVAATTLQVDKLKELVAAAFASILKGKTTEQMRNILKMKKGYTDEEEERIRNDGPWPGVDDVDEDEEKKTKNKKK